MVKAMVMMKRKKGLTMEAFSSYWADKHAPLAFGALPEGIRVKMTRYVQNYVINWSGSSQTQFDGIAEFCYEDMESFLKWMDWYVSDEGKILHDDEDNFVDKSTVNVVLLEENAFVRE